MSKRQSREQFASEMKAVLPKVSINYEGKAILVPGPSEVAGALGYTKAMMYHWGSTYTEKLEVASGLTVIHNGIVLGDEQGVIRPNDETDSAEIKELTERISNLPTDERARLILKLTLESQEHEK